MTDARELHSLLKSQCHRWLSPELLADPAIAALLAAVDTAYEEADRNRAENVELRASQLRIEEALAREEANYRLFVERLPAITYVAEPGAAGRWRFVSPQVETLLGYTVAEWTGNPRLWYERLHPDDREVILAEEERCIRARDQFSLEYRLLAKDGRVVWVRDGAVFLSAGAGEPDRLQGFMFDITERRLLEEQLVQAQKAEAIGQLAGGIAHDFNNLLTAISGYAELVLHRLGEGSPHAPELNEILRASERAARVTGKLLAFSRRQQLDLRSFDLNSLLIEIEALLRRLIGEHVQLELSLAAGPAVVRAEPTQIEQVVMNLIVNARDAMPTGGLVRLATKLRTVEAAGRGAIAGVKPGRCVELSVADNGVGMDTETLRRLFEPFFTTKPVGQGTGLGLATAFGIVRQSGGAILVESRPGEGSVFRVVLPMIASEQATHLWSPASSPLVGGSEHVLLVEDDAAVRDFAVSLLHDLGYRVTSASDGVEALAIVDREGASGFDLLWTDVVMPRLDGADLAHRLRERRPDLPVLFASGYARSEGQLAILQDRHSAYLQKPFTPTVLAETLRRLLAR